MRSWLAALCICGLAACDADTTSGSEGDAVGTADVGADTTSVDDPPYFEGEQYMLADSHANILRTFTFMSVEDGVVGGFDLDGRTSTVDDRETCGHADLVDPDGNVGIDNQLGNLWPALEPLIGLQVEELLQGAINEGRFLLTLEVVGLGDDMQNGTDVTVNLFRTLLKPEIGTLGLITPDQTFYYDYEGPVSSVSNATMTDGVLEAGPLEFQLPITILDADFMMHVKDARLRLTLHADGTFTGMLGGALHVQDVLDEIYQTGARAEAKLVTPIFVDNADLAPDADGVCTMFSVALGVEGTTAFVVRDAAKEK